MDASGNLALVTDILPGVEGWLPEAVIRAGDRAVRSPCDRVDGSEMQPASLEDFGCWLAEPYGSGCGASSIGASGSAELGRQLTLTLEAEPLVSAGLSLSPVKLYADVALDCQVSITIPLHSFPALTGAQGNTAKSSAIPCQPGLVGASVYLQWVSGELGGPLVGSIELSDGLEVVIGA